MDARAFIHSMRRVVTVVVVIALAITALWWWRTGRRHQVAPAARATNEPGQGAASLPTATVGTAGRIDPRTAAASRDQRAGHDGVEATAPRRSRVRARSVRRARRRAPGATLKGRVLTAAGAPVEGAKLDAHTTGVAPAAGYQVEVPASGVVEHDFVLEAGGSIAGTVSDQDGAHRRATSRSAASRRSSAPASTCFCP